MMVLLIFLLLPIPIIFMGEELGAFMYWAWHSLMTGSWGGKGIDD